MLYHVIISENNKQLMEERRKLMEEHIEEQLLEKQLMEVQLLEKQLMEECLTEQINQLKKENMHLQQRSHIGNAQTM